MSNKVLYKFLVFDALLININHLSLINNHLKYSTSMQTKQFNKLIFFFVV